MVRTALVASAFVLATAPAALAQDDATPELTIYTYDSFAADWGPAPGLKEGFEANCGCTVNFVAVDSSIGALRRVQLEGDTTEADIVLGLDTSISGEARDTGLFAEHGLELGDLDVPRDWQSDLFVPFDYGYFAFVYDTDRLENPPASFEELANAEDLTIAIQDPRSSTPGLGVMLWVKAAYGERAGAMWEDIAPHVVTVTPGWSEAYNLFLEGEADMALSYTTSPAYHAIAEDDASFAAARFEEGHYPQIEVAGIVDSSDNKQLARDFLTYLVSEEGQAGIPTTNWMYPVRDLDLAEGFERILEPEDILLIEEDRITQNREAWIEEMLSALQ